MSIPLRALIVEDSEDDTQLLLRVLRRGGYDVTHERVEAAAEMQAALARQAWDIVLSDYRMPGFSGLAALEILKESGLDLPFIIISGTIGEDIAVAAMKAGAHDYLMKGKLARLGPAIERELREVEDRRARRQAEEALAESEARFRSLVENATVGIYRTTPDGRILMANPTLVRMLGYDSFQELASRNLEEEGFEPQFRRRDFRERIEREGQIKGLEAAWTRHDGSVFFARESASVVRGADGRVLYYDGVVEDITERKRAEEALRASEEHYRNLFENASDIIFTCDLTGNFTSINRAAEQIAGYTREEALRMNLLEVVAAEYGERAARWLQRAVGGETPPFGQWEIVAKDGRRLLVEASIQLSYQEGKPVAVQGIARDITARKRAEEMLRLSEQRFSQAFNASPEPITIATLRDGIYIDVNESFLRVTGHQREEVIGRSSLDVGFWERAEDRAEMLEALERDGLVRDFEMIFVTKSGQKRKGLLSTEIIEVGGQRCLLSVIKDITERLQLEEQFRQAQKMEAVGRLAGGIAHDFNNLLTIITGYGQLLLEVLPEADSHRQPVTEMLKAADRATSLTRQMLAFSRRQALAPQVLDLGTVVANTERMLRRLIGEDVELVTILGEGLGYVKADPGQIEQVILNLAVNARDAMPGGGRLTIETSNVLLDETYAGMHVAVEPGPYVMLAVSDTGCGMDAETQSHIFEPFFTTKEKGKGTGLGLATVYGIVKQSGGYIWVYSEIGQGTTFKIYLPRVLEPAQLPEALAPPKSLARGSETILLVEDDVSVRALAHDVLESRGYRVLVARDGQDALSISEQHKGTVHLLLTDVVMPAMSGRDLAEHLTPTDREMKVLYMSGYADDAIVHRGVLDPDVEFLQKPFSPQALADKVRAVLDKNH